MHAAVDNFIAQSLVGALRYVIVDERIGSYLDAPVIAGPLFRLANQFLAHSAMAKILRNVPPLDVSGRL